VEAADLAGSAPRRSAGKRLAGLFHGRPGAQAGALLAGPVGWLVIGYLGSLAVMLLTAFWGLGELSGEIEHTLTLDNFKQIVQEPVYREVALRTVGMAALVTVTCVFLAFPIAFYMAKLASGRAKAFLVVAVLMPLWSGYLVKVYTWRTIMGGGGPLDSLLGPIGLGAPHGDLVRIWLVMTYLWLPYMIIPIYAGLERIPSSLREASSDLGGRPRTTFRRVILPLALPAVVAGSIFTFSLTLGDYITPTLVSGTQFIGNVVYSNVSVNQPLAAAYAIVPVAIMIVYLLIARRLGAFEAL
jgi:putative spermidine/putrescine transport system permease protein